MKRRLFLDTGFLIALEAVDDQYHPIALAHWENLIQLLPRMVTTSYVFDEIVTFFNSRSRHTKAVDIGNLLLASPSIQFIHIDETLFHEAWQYFVQHSDKSYSLTDCASFIMKRLRIRTALTFDNHFVQAGFAKEPEITDSSVRH
ncbi:MAG: PIN domain-containing protein [Deltaproteobacteria bacterium]|nr:PIN domain-containing protein [Deltaproteobacteria bacterium]